MKNRRIAIFLIVLFGVLSLTGCGIEKEVTKEEKTVNESQAENLEKEPQRELIEEVTEEPGEFMEEEPEGIEDAEEDEVYGSILQEIIENGIFPATAGAVCDGMPYDNTYSVMDVDGDGREELLVNYTNTFSYGSMVLYIYDYDRNTKEVYIEYAGFPDMTIYENGYLKEEASHNHGRSNLDDFWPYYLYQYNEETDIYERTACMDAWEQREEDAEFPSKKDTDGDGIVYYDFADDYYEPQNIMDNAEYEKWCENYNTAKKIEILWYPIISEEKYNEMHTDAAAG